MHRLRPNLLRRTALFLAAATFGALALVGLPTRPASAAQTPATCANVSIVNGSFETPALAANTWALFDDSLVTGWTTTATDRRIEIWRTPFQGVPAPDGTQFVELSATQRATLYQDLATTPGETIRWQLQHRGRTGVDTMAVRLGVPGAPLTVQSTIANGQTWVTYSGFYTVPTGQTTTRLALESVSSANGNASYGNLVDAVSVTSGACVVTSKSVNSVSGNDPVRLGDTLEYSIVATNQGASAASLTTVLDALPVGVSLVPGTISVTHGASTTAVTDSAGDDVGEYDVGSREVRARVGAGASSTLGGSLQAGTSVTVTFRVLVDSVAALPSIDNTVTVAFADALSSMSRTSTSNTTTTTIAPDAPALSIVTSGTVTPAGNQNSAAVGDTIVWSYLVSNTGDVPLSDVTVVDPEGGVISCSPTTVGVGESATCVGNATYVVTSADVVVGGVSNGATARATPPFGAAPVDSLESVATITTEALAPAIAVTVSHDNLSALEPNAPILVGNQIRARFVVTNGGNANLSNVGVSDPVFGAVTCATVTLAAGESTTCEADDLYTVTEDDADTGTISRTITAAGVAVVGVTSTSVSDLQLVTLSIANPALASTGAALDPPLALALVLVGVGAIALGAARLSARRRVSPGARRFG